jgi:hypothetical protein
MKQIALTSFMVLLGVRPLTAAETALAVQVGPGPHQVMNRVETFT